MTRRVFMVCLLLWSCGLRDGLSAQPNDGNTVENPSAENNDPALNPPVGDQSRLTDLPLLEEMKIPSAEELLTGEKVAWILLKQKRVIVSRPISPRPYTLETLETKLMQLREQGTPTNPEKLSEFEEEVFRLRRVRGALIDEESETPEFYLKTQFIERIWHHEDLLLKRASLLLDEGELESAYELLYRLQLIDSEWPGLHDANSRLIFLNGEKLLAKKQIEAALVRFEQLFERNPDYPNLANRLDECTRRLIDGAIGQADCRQARHYLHRLESKRPNSSVVQQKRDALIELMKATLADARKASQDADRLKAVESAERAARVWPYSTELRDTFRQLSNDYQILKVGVLQPAGQPSPYPFPLDSDERLRSLVEKSLFEIDEFDDSPHYTTALIEQWEPTELGRHIEMRMRTSFDYWSSLEALTAVGLADSLRDSLNPSSLQYDEQLAGFVEEVRVLSPYRLELQFRRTPLRPEALLARSISNLTSDSNWFTERMRTSERCAYVRVISEPEQVPRKHVAEIQEIAYKNHEEVLRALFRGEIDFIPELPVRHVANVEHETDWFVRRYQVPQTHLIQFHPDSLPARSSELRRALLYAIDREKLLREEILQGAPEQSGRLTTAVFPRQSRAYSPLVKEIAPDPLVARSLVLAVQKSLGGKLPELRMAVPPDASLKPVMERFVRAWARSGITVVVIPADDPNPSQWDLVYRKVTLMEPLTRLWPLLTQQNHARVADLQRLPGWLRQEMIQLELTTNWNSARGQLHQLHDSLWREVFLIPLWEVDRFSMARRNLSGIPQSPLHPYQSIDRWIVDPWFDASRP